MVDKIKYKGQIYVRQDADMPEKAKIEKLQAVVNDLKKAETLINRAATVYKQVARTARVGDGHPINVDDVAFDVAYFSSSVERLVKNGRH